MARSRILGNGLLAASASYPWYQAAGTIALSNVYEYVTLPSAGQAYAGSTIANNLPYTIAFRTTDAGCGTKYVFDFNGVGGTGGRIACGYVPGNGFIESQWWGAVTNSLFSSGDNVYFIVVSASQVATFYRNNSQVGSTYNHWATGVGNAAGARWRSLYNNAASNVWTPSVTAGAVYNVAIDSTQRSALYTAMAAL